MSFAGQVKDELTAIEPPNACCAAAQAYGMAQCGHAFSKTDISLKTESAVVAERYQTMLKTVCGVSAFRWQKPAAKNGFHIVSLTEESERLQVLGRFGHRPEDVSLRLNRANLECEDCMAAYLRGAFLSCGAVTNPAHGYHLEFCLPYYRLSRDLPALFRELSLESRTVRRKGDFVLYFKESEQIEDCLTVMGAVNASLELMNVKLIKDIRNNLNRVINCESANIDKTVAAAAVQLQAVRKIAAGPGGLGALPSGLRQLAALRLENPELSLRELGEALEPPLSRSGVNHRLQRILAWADKL